MRTRKIIYFQSKIIILFLLLLSLDSFSFNQTLAYPINKQQDNESQGIYEQVVELDKIGKTTEAINKAQAAIKSGIVSPKLLIFLAELYEKNSEFDNALSCYQIAENTMGIDFFSSPINLPYRIGRLLYQLMRYKESIQYLESACHHNTYKRDNPRAYKMLAYAYTQTGYIAESYQAYLTLLSVYPNDTSAWEAIAQIKQSGNNLTVSRKNVPAPMQNINRLLELGNPLLWGIDKLREGVLEYTKMSDDFRKNGYDISANQFIDVVFGVSISEGVKSFKAKNYNETIKCFSLANQAHLFKSLPNSDQEVIWSILFFSHWRLRQYVHAITIAEIRSKLPTTEEGAKKQVELISEFIKEAYDSVSWDLQTQSRLTDNPDEFAGHLVPLITEKIQSGEPLYFVPYGMTSRSEDFPSIGEQDIALRLLPTLEKESKTYTPSLLEKKDKTYNLHPSIYRFMTSDEQGKFINKQINSCHLEFPLKLVLFDLFLVSISYDTTLDSDRASIFSKGVDLFARLDNAIENSEPNIIRQTTLDAATTAKKIIAILINLDKKSLGSKKLEPLKLQESEQAVVLTETYFLKAANQPALIINDDFVSNESLDFVDNLEDWIESYFQDNYLIKEKLYRTTLKIREKILGAQEEKVTTALLTLANILLKEKKTDEAFLFLNKALAIKNGLKGTVLCGAINSLASIYQDKADYEQAESLYKKALKICEESAGVQSSLYAGTLNSLGSLYYFKEKFVEAKEAMEQSLRIREKLPNSDNSEVANSLSSLALLYNKLGDTNKAEETYRHALSLYEKKNNIDRLDSLSTISNFGSLLSNQSKFEEAQTFFNRAMLICEQSFGKDSLATTNILNNIANNFFRQGKYNEAEEISLKVLSIVESNLGEKNLQTAFAIDNAATILFAQKKYAQTEILLKRNLLIYSEAYTEKHQNVALALTKLAIFYKNINKSDLAEIYHKKALSVLDEVEDCNVSIQLHVIESYIDMLQSSNRLEEADMLLKRIVSIKNKKK